MKRNNIPAILALLALVALGGCQSDGEATGPRHGLTPLAITLSDATVAQSADGTRAAAERGTTRAASGTTSFAEGSAKIYFSEGTVVDGSGTVTNSAAGLSAAQGLYLRPDLDRTWADAYIPSDYAPAATTEFTVKQDQSGDANYKASDLMYGGTLLMANAAGTAAEGTIAMQHVMAQLQVTLSNAASTEATVELVSGFRTIAVTNAKTCRLTTQNTIDDHSGLSDEITPAAPLKVGTVGAGATATVACVVPPQQLAVSQALVRVSYTSGDPVVYSLPRDLVLESGRSYLISVKAGDAAPGLTVSMTAWNAAAGSQTAPTTASGAPNTYYVGSTSFRMVPVAAPTSDFSVELTDADVTTTKKTVSATVAELTGYQLGETEVTIDLWDAVCGDPTSATDHKDASGVTVTLNAAKSSGTYPMYNFSWNQAVAFIDKLNQMTAAQRPSGCYFCLPTMAEWHYAARGGIHRPATDHVYAGSDDDTDVAWTSVNTNADSYGISGGIRHVAQLRANEMGLYDMSGNVCEYVADLTPSGTVYLMSGGANLGKLFSQIGTFMGTQTSGRTKDSNTQHRGLRLCLRKIRVGDVYFSDGSVGPVAEHPGKTAVGIVFSTETTAADQLRGYRNGYAMALTNAATDVAWCASVANADGLGTNLQSVAVTGSSVGSGLGATLGTTLGADRDGLTHCRQAVAAGGAASGWNPADLTAIASAMGYTGGAAPAASSGWYLPASGQLCDILVNLGGLTPAWGTLTSTELQYIYVNSTGNGAVRTAINAHLSAISGAETLPATKQFDLASSTESGASQYWAMFMDNGNRPGFDLFDKGKVRKNYTSAESGVPTYVRPVLAF